MLPDPIEVELVDPPEPDQDKPYWMRQTIDGSLVLHNPDGTFMGDIYKRADERFHSCAAKVDGTLHRSVHETEKEAMQTLLRLHPDHKPEEQEIPW